MNDTCLLNTFGKQVRIEFTDKEIAPWGGIVLMKKLIEKTGITTDIFCKYMVRGVSI